MDSFCAFEKATRPAGERSLKGCVLAFCLPAVLRLAPGGRSIASITSAHAIASGASRFRSCFFTWRRATGWIFQSQIFRHGRRHSPISSRLPHSPYSHFGYHCGDSTDLIAHEIGPGFNFGINASERQKWEQVRTRGHARFILRNFLRWGVPMCAVQFVGPFIYDTIMHRPYAPFAFFPSPVWNAIFPPCGFRGFRSGTRLLAQWNSCR